MPKIKIRKSRSVPYALRILGTVALTAFFGFLLNQLDEQTFIMTAIAVSPLLPLLWMSVKVLEINDDKKYWWTYHWILGYKWGKKIPYPSISHLKIESKLIQPRRRPEYLRYQLFAHFSNETTCLLTQRKNLDFLLEKAEKMAEKVGVELVFDEEIK